MIIITYIWMFCVNYYLIKKQYCCFLFITLEDIIDKLLPEYHYFVHNYHRTHTLRRFINIELSFDEP